VPAALELSYSNRTSSLTRQELTSCGLHLKHISLALPGGARSVGLVIAVGRFLSSIEGPELVQ
jgi:hypothetical protein